MGEQSGGCLEAQGPCDHCGTHTGEKPCFDGFWDVQPKSLSPNGAILGNMIRQGEEVRVREKCGGFVLVIEGVSIAHRPS